MGEIIDVSLIQNKKFYKFTNYEELHHGLQYNSGVNVDPIPFNPSGECSEGGMYFFEQSQLLHYPSYVQMRDVWWIREVILLPTSKVYKEQNKYKTNTFFLKERKRFDYDLSGYVTKQMCLDAITIKLSLLKYVPESLMDKEMCIEAIRNNRWAIRFVPDDVVNEEMCCIVINKRLSTISYTPFNFANIKKIIKHMHELKNIPQSLMKSVLKKYDDFPSHLIHTSFKK